MKNKDNSNFFMAEMERNLNANADLFSSAATIEKVAFRKVSDEDLPGEIEQEFEKMTKTASKECDGCEDDCHNFKQCDCDCHDKTEAAKSASEITNALLQISADLDFAGFEKLATASLIIADRLVCEAKAKKKPAKSDSKSKSVSKSEKDKSKSEKDKSKSVSKSEKDKSKSKSVSKSSPADKSKVKKKPVEKK